MKNPPNINVYEHGILTKDHVRLRSLRQLATTKMPVYSGFNLTVIDNGGKSLNERAVQLFQVNGPHTLADYFEESDLRYCVLATLYHLNRIIDLYVENAQLFEETYPSKTTLKGNVWNSNVFYEIDAFLGAARRVYESIRKVLWKHYQGRGTTGRWSSIRKVFTSPGNVPKSFLDVLDKSWQTVGVKLTYYRDCVAHYEPLTDGMTTCWLDRFEGMWGVTIKLPANPEVQSRMAYDFASGPEALEYCHVVARHLVDLCESLQAEPKIRAYLDNPPTHT
jgi:hypothetical protein